jgi:hypothetical protein
MTSDIIFYAPTGDELQGTLEEVQASCTVKFDTPERDFHHDGSRTNIFDNGMHTKQIGGTPVFLDESGQEWLQHHLILDSDPLSQATIELFNHEFHIGTALETARRLRNDMNALPDNQFAPALANLPQAIRDLEQAYAAAKAISIEAAARELAMRVD